MTLSFEYHLGHVRPMRGFLACRNGGTRKIGCNALSSGVSAQYAEEDEDEVDPMSSEDVPGGGTRRDQTRMKSELCNQERNETKSKE